MDNIRLSINFMKLSGSRLISAKNAANKQATYLAIPIEHFFVPTNDPKPYLMCSMIPCPNAQYGDFMIKPFVSGTDWDHLSQEQRNAMPIIGKGTFMRPAVNKAIRQEAANVQIEDIDPTSLTPTQAADGAGGSAAPLVSAPSHPEGVSSQPTVPATRFEVLGDDGASWWLGSWNDAAAFASEDNANRRKIVWYENNVRRSQWHWDESKITWLQDF